MLGVQALRPNLVFLDDLARANAEVELLEQQAVAQMTGMSLETGGGWWGWAVGGVGGLGWVGRWVVGLGGWAVGWVEGWVGGDTHTPMQCLLILAFRAPLQQHTCRQP